MAKETKAKEKKQAGQTQGPDKAKRPSQADYEEKYKRALADYQNLLKRTEAEKQALVKFANEQLLLKIIPIYDNLRLAWQHANGEKDKADANKNILEGLGYVLKQFKDALVEIGVQEIISQNQAFDPQTMEAVETKKTADKNKDNLVAQEIKPGYKLHNRTLIPARVVVYKYEKENKETKKD